MKERGIHKMIFASSSSVYGNQSKVPFSESDSVDNPISPYAFTKKSCELLNYSYHHLHDMDIINLRFFTVFGPRQRPDLAIHKFVKLITEDKHVTMYGNGETARDYTYIADILQGINGALNYIQNNNGLYEIANLGNNRPVKLSDMIAIIGEKLDTVPDIKHLSEQAGDVSKTCADITKANHLFGYSPQVTFEDGISKFIDWYMHNKVASPSEKI
jgi:UDP-glucuronate 4-epimerase